MVGEWTPLPVQLSTEGSNPPPPHRLNRGPVKAVRHGGSGWVASEGEGGRVSDRAGVGKEPFAVLDG